ncbi:MAG: P-loop NTPase, partial [Flavobacteriales bacterium]|nr:P-loop NTPase [Flavobacteriales bacterium]
PQPVALADARKGVGLFRLPSVNVPVLGIVENMAWFTPEELPENRYYIFGHGGARALADELKVPFLAEVP